MGGSLLAVLLTTAVQAAQPGKLKPDIERGEQLYLENCWHCHGKGALGDGPLAQQGPVPAPALAGRVPTDSDPWVTIIHRGKDTMPAFGPVFDRHDARRVLVWLAALDPADPFVAVVAGGDGFRAETNLDAAYALGQAIGSVYLLQGLRPAK